MSTAHQKIKEGIEKHAEEIKDLSLKIHQNPELGFEEFNALKWQKEFLKQQGITEDTEIVVHSPQFEKVSATEFALEQMLKTAEILARVGYNYFTDSDFREKVHKDFDN